MSENETAHLEPSPPESNPVRPDVGVLSARIEALRLELEAAKLERDVSELKRNPPPEVQEAQRAVILARLSKEAADLKPPQVTRWWHSWGSVAGITAIISAMVPITTAVINYFGNRLSIEMEQTKNKHELNLKEQQLQHQISTDKIKQFDEVGRAYLALSQDPKQRARVLRFTKSTAPIPDIRNWADDELKIVEVEIEQLKQELEDIKRAALPHICLKWEFEDVTGDLPPSRGKEDCASRGVNEFGKRGTSVGHFYQLSVDKEWQRSNKRSKHSAMCECLESRPVETSTEKP